MAKPISTWWERAAAIGAIAALGASIFMGHLSCGGEDLIFSGIIPTGTVAGTATPTETPEPDEGI